LTFLTSDEVESVIPATSLVDDVKNPLWTVHQMIDCQFVIVEIQFDNRQMLLFLLNHFPHENPLIVMILHLLVDRVDEHLLKAIAMEAFKAENVHQSDGKGIAAER
jgi:hypothetical protein